MTVQVENIDVQKELVRSQSNGFTLQDQHEAVNMGNMAKPRLLTVLMGGADVTAREYGQTHVWQYDETKYTPQAVTGKRYDERGADIKKDQAKTRYYEIGSKGLRLNVSPMDYDGRRKAGTNELLTEADVLADQIMKAQDAFSLETELEYASLLTEGKNRTAGGSAPVYDFALDILGASRPTASNIDFASTTVNPDRQVSKIRQKIEATAAKYGLSTNGYVVVCGDNFFDAAFEYERKATIGRSLRSTLDLVSMMVPQLQAGDFRYDNFESSTSGVTYVRYGATFFGSRVIGTDEAYIFPLLSGETLVKEAYAPAKVRGIVNTQALSLYSWFYTDDFEGVTGFYEQNKLTALPRPDLITSLTI